MAYKTEGSGRENLKDELKYLNEQIETLKAEKKELEAFNYRVAHDLYSPLMRIEGYSSILLRDHLELLDGAAEDYLLRVCRAAQQMKTLLNGLLNFSRAKNAPLNKQRIDLSQMALEILEDLCKSEPARKVEIRVQPHVVVFGDKILIRILVTNILANAWKYTAHRECAKIELGRSETDDENADICFVSDNGIGFDAKQADQLFIPFQRLCSNPEYDGNGIGLATAERIVQRHGGQIWALGAPDKGASIHFQLPN